MTGFEFPRDPKSSFGLIDADAIRTSVLKLVDGLENAFWSSSIDALAADMGGWAVDEVCTVAAACAFLKGIDPATDYDAALVRQSLVDQLALNRDIDPATLRTRAQSPGRP
jgi:hypothetical protein